MKTREDIKKLFLILQTIYLRKWRDNFTTNEVIEIAIEQWREALANIENDIIHKAAKYCRDNLEWPPSIAEFISICEKVNGMPSLDECLQAAIREDYFHPIIKKVRDRIGSWNMSHDTEEVLARKFKQIYEDEIHQLRMARTKLKIIEGEKDVKAIA